MLYFKTGCMNSSKTMNLIMAEYNYRERGFITEVYRPKIADRGEGINRITSRAGGTVLCKPIDEQFTNFNENVDVILVDEAQFLTIEQVEKLYEISAKIPVLTYGLLTDFKRELFPGSKRLMELSDSTENFKTICQCGRKASINGRFIDGQLVREGNQISVEKGKVEYKSLCRFCYDKGGLKWF